MLPQSIEVPEITIHEKVRIDPARAAVIVVDMQNDFVHPRGKLFVPDAPKTVPSIARLIGRARARNIPVIYTQDWHMEEDPEFKIWGEHAVAGTWGAEIVEDLKPLKGDIVIKKLRYDAFYGTQLEHLLSRVVRRDVLIVVGTVANICVLHTAGSAALRWFDVVVPMDGVSALTQFDLYAALRQIDFLYRGRVVRSVDGIEFTD